MLSMVCLHAQTRVNISPSRSRLPGTTLASAFKEPIESRCQIGSASIQICRSDLTPGLDQLFKADARVVLASRPRLGLMFTRVCACRQIVESTFAPSCSGIGQVARPASPEASACARIWAVDRGTGASQCPSSLPALRVACRYSPVGFDRQQ